MARFGRVLVVCNGAMPSRALASRLARAMDSVVAADGGANAARRYGIRPDVIIGDLDSVSAATRRAFAVSSVIQVSRQDNTDLEKVLDYLLLRGTRSAVIIGAAGKRVDFTLGNFATIWRYAEKIDLRLMGDDWTAMPVGSFRSVKAPVGATVSLIPCSRCLGVTLKGLHYPLEDAMLRIGDIAVSNIVRRSPFQVRVAKGKLLMVVLATAVAGRR